MRVPLACECLVNHCSRARVVNKSAEAFGAVVVRLPSRVLSSFLRAFAIDLCEACNRAPRPGGATADLVVRIRQRKAFGFSAAGNTFAPSTRFREIIYSTSDKSWSNHSGKPEQPSSSVQCQEAFRIYPEGQMPRSRQTAHPGVITHFHLVFTASTPFHRQRRQAESTLPGVSKTSRCMRP